MCEEEDTNCFEDVRLKEKTLLGNTRNEMEDLFQGTKSEIPLCITHTDLGAAEKLIENSIMQHTNDNSGGKTLSDNKFEPIDAKGRNLTIEKDFSDDSFLERGSLCVRNMDKPDSVTKKWPQYVAGLFACIPMLCAGCCMSWTSPALEYLEKPQNGTQSLTNVEGSWVASMMPLGALIGSLPAGYLADKIGRKKSIISLTFPMLLGWVIIIFVDFNAIALYIARFLSGFTIGAVTVVIPLYNEEISEVDIRGTLGCYTDFMISAGFLWSYCFGSFLSYFWFNIACLLPTVLFYFTFVWMPESPVYFLSKSKEAEAVNSLQFLRGAKYLKNYDSEPEIILMKGYLKEGSSSDSNEPGNIFTRLEYVKQCVFISKNMTTTAQAMRIVFGLIIIIQLSGVEGFIYYTFEIYKRGQSSIPLHIANLVIGIVQFIPSLVSAFTVDRFGRRFWLLTSGVGMTFGLLSLTVHSALLQVEGYIEFFGWMPCFSSTLFIASYAAGCASLPWLLMAELVPTESKGWVGSITVFLMWLFQMIISQAFNVMLNNINDIATYTIFGIFCIFNVIYTALCVPETKHKSRLEIQNELLKRISKTTHL